jgi:glycosyltransferase involved in cell wall biosynthesis
MLIDDLEPATIAKAINSLLADKELYREIRQNCRVARQELNWQKEKSKLISFYQGLFNDQR